MRRFLQIKEKSFGSNHPEVATGLNNLATLLNDTNRLSDASPNAPRSPDQRGLLRTSTPKRRNPPQQPGSVASGDQPSRQAEPLMRALAIDERSYGPQHPTSPRDLNNLAQLLQATNRLSEAEPLMRRAIAIDEQSFGTNIRTLPRLSTTWLSCFRRPTVSRKPTSDAACGGDFRAKPGVRPSEHQSLSQQFDLVAKEIASRSEPPSSPAGAQDKAWRFNARKVAIKSPKSEGTQDGFERLPRPFRALGMGCRGPGVETPGFILASLRDFLSKDWGNGSVNAISTPPLELAPQAGDLFFRRPAPFGAFLFPKRLL